MHVVQVRPPFYSRSRINISSLIRGFTRVHSPRSISFHPFKRARTIWFHRARAQSISVSPYTSSIHISDMDRVNSETFRFEAGFLDSNEIVLHVNEASDAYIWSNLRWFSDRRLVSVLRFLPGACSFIRMRCRKVTNPICRDRLVTFFIIFYCNNLH